MLQEMIGQLEQLKDNPAKHQETIRAYTPEQATLYDWYKARKREIKKRQQAVTAEPAGPDLPGATAGPFNFHRISSDSVKPELADDGRPAPAAAPSGDCCGLLLWAPLGCGTDLNGRKLTA